MVYGWMDGWVGGWVDGVCLGGIPIGNVALLYVVIVTFLNVKYMLNPKILSLDWIGFYRWIWFRYIDSILFYPIRFYSISVRLGSGNDEHAPGRERGMKECEPFL